MKILHTADWHLGKKLDHFSRFEEQKKVMNEICAIADVQNADVVIVAGDLFDTFNPPVEAVDLLYKTLKKLTNNGKRPVIAIAGNHDSPDRIDAPNPLARACGILFVGNPDVTIPKVTIENGFEITQSENGFLEIQLPQYDFPIRIITTPYANEMRLKTYLGAENKEEQLNQLLQDSWAALADIYCDTKGVNILTTHLYMLKRGGEILEEPEGEKPLRIGNADIVYTDCIPYQIQYTALGHLHRFQNVGGHLSPVVYSSSPLSYSFSEAGQDKKVVLIEAQPNEVVKFTDIPLQSGRVLHRKRFESIDEAVTWLLENPYCLVELTLVSGTFFASQDLKRIHESHDGIIFIIPIVTKDGNAEQHTPKVNLEQNIQGLFKDYFVSKHKQEPNEELLDLFNEIIGSQAKNE
ncbi:Exodeoxyribonuclease I subunit D [Flavobacterium fryxellicola]|uniref:Nuclease SbcCD subunit D n=1 Tax=Flavobacterium fryxellicola TaxID=249352 RepID=A0A167YGM7_9FLAO|nr:exonuclease subunit SbcD [Flavobacterium fryxellicola]OAB29393.1 exonuclease sbcCD subunit D [Flavobacterium fryxellicola]SHN80039.1 Exodeoxyribonuclease I subunit D [Flavobacterium fryxellicola]